MDFRRKTVRMDTKKGFPLQLSPPQVLVLGFAGVILAGTLLLMLPVSSRSGTYTDFLTALFTATSAVCVTGLVVVDTGTYWSTFGQAVILALIQIGGLGFMSMATLFFILMGRRIGLKERLIIQESLNQLRVAGVVRLVRAVLLFTVFTEGFFAVVLSLRFYFDYGFPRCLWLGIFHAVSAFNNAGFDLLGDFRSLTGYVSDPVVTLSVTTLIILGGLGFSTVMELYNYPRTRRLSVHTKLVLRVTGWLIFCGALLFGLLEWGHILRDLPLSGKILASYFQAVTPRTAGFNTVDIGHLNPATQFLIIILMFIGASPGSTGGGIKTTTFALLGITLWSLSKGKEDVEVFRRRIPPWQVYKALSVTLWAILLVSTVTLLLSVTEGGDFLAALFETVSAFGTVGLSMGLTPHLTPLGRVAIILTMFAGRLGPLTLAYAFAQRRRKTAVRYPEEKIMVG
ncbi:trk system potassium uptake protein TrkH [Desulfofundulus luciae]|uniref:Trk system potassium uptake protein TrkH n=1 Tax=Desulfofundulus luciae TaxID=74702 RepID=A0ABU0B578_9FIRM|nr:TrkH family potassium uptake protein [Desulfofundulus luciae]MDQ0287439.1 trk system potassium uptake protein TrkH [Desulfofundulus luciae]